MSRAPAIFVASSLILATVVAGSFAWGGSPTANVVAAGVEVDYERSFTKNFPESDGEHRIVDWALYAALVAGDVVTYAARLDPGLATELEKAKGRGYQTQQLERRIKDDAQLVAAFDEQRRRMKSMVVYTDGGGIEDESCRHPLVYIDNEFRLVLGESGEGQDPLSHATIAPACPRVLARGFQITAGRSSRFKCWVSQHVTACGWRLPDMPRELKQVIESTYPAGSTKLRWRWRGLGGSVQTRYVDSLGNRVGPRDGVFVSVPVDLRLEFVDERGHVVWTTGTTGRGSGSRGRPAL